MIKVKVDAASTIELEQCLGGKQSLGSFCAYCHRLITCFLERLGCDFRLRVLLQSEGLPEPQSWASWEVCLLLCSNRRMAQWNYQFRGESQATDILSFPSDLGGGDLLLSLRYWLANCRESGCRPAEELRRLLLHGLLHLAGLDHDEEASPMLQYQESLLKKWAKREPKGFGQHGIP